MIFSLNHLLQLQSIARFIRLNCSKNEQLAGAFIDLMSLRNTLEIFAVLAPASRRRKQSYS